VAAFSILGIVSNSALSSHLFSGDGSVRGVSFSMFDTTTAQLDLVQAAAALTAARSRPPCRSARIAVTAIRRPQASTRSIHAAFVTAPQLLDNGTLTAYNALSGLNGSVETFIYAVVAVRSQPASQPVSE
jgi:hypothetical protein